MGFSPKAHGFTRGTDNQRDRTMKAWRGWYHVTGGTYGSWLPGDPRGWRARGRREHVDGDGEVGRPYER